VPGLDEFFPKLLYTAAAFNCIDLSPWYHTFAKPDIGKVESILEDPDIMMISFRFLIALFTEINKMVKVNLTENNILLILFSILNSEK
jgi:predicted membrane channel-forming protein YqfA (hemolysin III family)